MLRWTNRVGLRVAVLAFATLVACAGHAQAEQGDKHGPAAELAAFPSHAFQLAPHKPGAQLGFSYGLLQPILLHGFNAAVDVRIGRWIATYSHGQGLDPSRVAGTLTDAEKDAGMRLREPYSTGGGIGLTLLDELYFLVDLKVHGFDAELDGVHTRYTTMTVGVELGYRLFLWKGLYVSPVLRYWPNVWDSANGRVLVRGEDGQELAHKPLWQGISGTGLFANVLIGWAFNLVDDPHRHCGR